MDRGRPPLFATAGGFFDSRPGRGVGDLHPDAMPSRTQRLPAQRRQAERTARGIARRSDLARLDHHRTEKIIRQQARAVAGADLQHGLAVERIAIDRRQHRARITGRDALLPDALHLGGRVVGFNPECRKVDRVAPSRGDGVTRSGGMVAVFIVQALASHVQYKGSRMSR